MGFLDTIKKFFGGEAPTETEAPAEAPAAFEESDNEPAMETKTEENQTEEEQPMQ